MKEHVDPDVRAPGYIDLREDLGLPGCAVCRGSSRSAWRHIDGVLWEGVTDPITRTRLRRSRGFCREHSFVAVRVAEAEHGELGMAIVYEDLLAQVEAELERAPGRERPRRRRSRATRADRGCPACETAHGTAMTYLRLLADADPGSELGSLARRGRMVVCLPHLTLALRSFDDRRVERLIDVARTGTATARRDLQEFIRKRDYRFSHEPVSDEEAGAWRAAVRFLVGDPMRRPLERSPRDPGARGDGPPGL